MNPEKEPATNLEAILGGQELRRLRQAYHKLEAFQLSDQHRKTKRKLRGSLRESERMRRTSPP